MSTQPSISPLLACPGCTLGHPSFLWTCFVVGTVSVSYLLLRPYVKGVKVWGIPRISSARLASLGILICGMIPLWLSSIPEEDFLRFMPHYVGIACALTYFWWRSCWLLDQHSVTGKIKTLLFPGTLGLVLAALGTVSAILILGLLLTFGWGFIWALYHIVTTLIVAAPLFFLAKAGLKFTFSNARKAIDRAGDAASIPENI